MLGILQVILGSIFPANQLHVQKWDLNHIKLQANYNTKTETTIIQNIKHIQTTLKLLKKKPDYGAIYAIQGRKWIRPILLLPGTTRGTAK